MIYLIIYLIGCVITYVLLATHNDRHFYEKMSGFWVVISWIFILSVLLGMVINFISNLNLYPTLKWFKKK